MNPFGGGFSASASSGAYGGTAGGASSWTQGDWNINLGGAGPSLQGAGSLSTSMLVLLAVGAVWFLMRK